MARAQVVVVVGPSGCGKSTLLALVAGLRRPSSGTVFCDGEPITGPMPRKVGMIFPEANLLPWLSAIDNVAFPLKLRRVAKAERLAAARRMPELTGLAGFEDRLPHQLHRSARASSSPPGAEGRGVSSRSLTS
jgi:NitT/TauT family transport system ATP-binding protein